MSERLKNLNYSKIILHILLKEAATTKIKAKGLGSCLVRIFAYFN